MLPAKFGSIWPSSLIGEDFFYISRGEHVKHFVIDSR
jgi:hypothetical protein